MKLGVWLLLVAGAFLGANDAARILSIFQVPAYSHQSVYRSLMTELAKRGHEIVHISPFPGLDHPNVTEISLESSQKIYQDMLNVVEMKQKKYSARETYKLVMDMTYAVLEAQYNQPEVKKLIAEAAPGVFDLVIFEYFTFIPTIAFGELFDCPMIGVTSMDTSYVVHEMFGNPSNPVIHPDALFFSFPAPHLSFTQRVYSLAMQTLWQLYHKPKDDRRVMKILHRHFPNVTANRKKLEDRVALMMVNTNLNLHPIRPLVPNFIQLGFLHIEPPKTLPNGDIKDFLDASKHGVIYVTFGTSIRTTDFSPQLRETFLNAFAKLKFDILWKFESDSIEKPKNVMISKWMPQSDVLAHPNVKLTLFHGGQQTLEESIDREVPMVVIPFIEEQKGSARTIVDKKIGLKLDFHSLNEKVLVKTIHEAMKPEYKKNVQHLKNLVYDQPETSRERAIWWTEFTIRNRGCDNLKYAGRDIPFYKEFCLDIFGFLVLICFAIVLIMKKCFQALQRKLSESDNKKKL